MEVDERNDREEESQASQILRSVLESDGGSAIQDTNAASTEDSNFLKHSSSSDSAHTQQTMPHYHYHGLASTQTQEEDEHSNTRVLSASSGNRAQGAVQAQSATKPLKRSIGNRNNDPFTKISGVEAVSSDSPSKGPATPARVSRYAPRATPAYRREESPDSFAGDSQDSAERYITNQRQFIVPVSELGRLPSPRISMEGAGRILVEDTPEPSLGGSGGSQSQSQPDPQPQDQGLQDYDGDDYPDTRQPEPQDNDDDLDDPTGSRHSTQNRTSSSPPCSFDFYKTTPHLAPTPIIEPTRIYEPTQPYEPTQLYEPTQPYEPTQIYEPTQLYVPTQILEPTQMLEQTQIQNIPSPKVSLDSFDAVEESLRANTSNIASTTTTGPRSLLDSIDPQKRQRYAHLVPAPIPSTSAQIVSRTLARRQAVTDERTYVVPDSEPPRESTPSPPPLQQPVSTRPKSRRRTPQRTDTESDKEPISPMDVDARDADQLRTLDTRSSREEEEDEDEDEEEEEIVLKAVKDVKGKGKAIQRRPASNKNTAAPHWSNGRTIKDASPEIVPSSVPHQDRPPKRSASRGKSRATVKSRLTAATKACKQSGSSKRACAKNINYQESTDDEEAENDEEEEYAHAGPSSRKRKRGIKVEESPSISLQHSRPKKGRRAVGSARSVKRVRRASAGDRQAPQATRIFGLWRKVTGAGAAFYPGYVHSALPDTDRYKVIFEDETSEELRLDQMRLLTPRVDDTVWLPNSKQTYTIVAVHSDEETVSVESSSSAEDSSKDVLIKNIRIPSRIITAEWKDRGLAAETIVCHAQSHPPFASPALTRSSVGIASQGVFSGTAFCITGAEQKEALSAKIIANGGVILEDWDEMFEMKGVREKGRWILKGSDVAPTPAYQHGIGRVFLLAKEESLTPKYVIALALGIPCLQLDYIKKAIATGERESKDWLPYLLPAGCSEFYGTPVSQFINAEWGESDDDASKLHLDTMTDIWDNRVAFKPLKGKKILCVGKRALGTGIHESIPKIMLAMGAESVVAVPKLKESITTANFDYVVDKDNDIDVGRIQDCEVVSWDWVKDAVISRCLPPIEEH
ncbi:DNA repair protein crb2 [Favolaschia claudopus]|uniref:DNA repair protein crb2 n=1 Tax=Favolaschia claudopus TaxID=2862362 RepID=A0AAW0B4B7_9AGAR